VTVAERVAERAPGTDGPRHAAKPIAAADRSERVAARARRQFLPEIQALRAIAVMLVVVYHFWPKTLTGGYIGVDAFFVISGYLITSHLLREADGTGTVRLWAFYARRARRLLPASILVLLAVAGGTVLLLPAALWASTAHEIAASGFYFQNLWLASKAVTYSSSNDVASPVTHYWSLSAEEQFYLVWPALIILSCLVARRLLRGRTTTTVACTLLLVTLGSFAYSVWATRAHPAAAYFLTPTRAWEFGAGGLVVLLMRRWAPAPLVARLLRWLGICGLLTSAWLFSSATSFPGYAAGLPVLATAAVIAAGDTGRGDPSDAVFRMRPVQWLGDASYSIYLWHWPLLVLAPYALHRALGTPDLLVLLAICLLIAGLSRRFVEDATRFWPRLRTSPRAALATAAVAMMLVGLASAGQVHAASTRERKSAAVLADVSGSPCFGGPAMENRAQCPDALTAAPLVPVGETDAPWVPDPACHGYGQFPRVDQTCYWGTGKPSRVVALVGDSHAQAWRAPLHRIAEASNWKLIEIFAAGCPANYAPSTAPGRAEGEDCPRWTRQTTDELRADHPDDVITTAYVHENAFASAAAGQAGFEATWRDWLRFTRVTVLRDVPLTGSRNGPQCLGVNAGNPQACANPRAKVLLDDDMTRAAAAMRGQVDLVDLSNDFCDASRCYAVIGGASVYFDNNHMTVQFSTTLAATLLRHLPST
jgi:peptidoglycan/LPS O-acetylase OafA/YrhL